MPWKLPAHRCVSICVCVCVWDSGCNSTTYCLEATGGYSGLMHLSTLQLISLKKPPLYSTVTQYRSFTTCLTLPRMSTKTLRKFGSNVAVVWPWLFPFGYSTDTNSYLVYCIDWVYSVQSDFSDKGLINCVGPANAGRFHNSLATINILLLTGIFQIEEMLQIVAG